MKIEEIYQELRNNHFNNGTYNTFPNTN